MSITIAMAGAMAAILCGNGQVERLDSYGNSNCVQASTGEVRSITSNSGGPCPGGSFPNLTTRGSGCSQPSTGQTFYPDRGTCPNGTARLLDQFGNEVCKMP
jgi:hypothetical protein